MLKKSLRLKKKEDFDRVFRNGHVIFFEEIACRFLKKPEGGFRLGFSLSKKQLPRAVDRNRFRRVFSALMTEAREVWPGATDVVFSLRRKTKVLGKKEYAPAFEYLLKAINTAHKK